MSDIALFGHLTCHVRWGEFSLSKCFCFLCFLVPIKSIWAALDKNSVSGHFGTGPTRFEKSCRLLPYMGKIERKRFYFRIVWSTIPSAKYCNWTITIGLESSWWEILYATAFTRTPTEIGDDFIQKHFDWYIFFWLYNMMTK